MPTYWHFLIIRFHEQRWGSKKKARLHQYSLSRLDIQEEQRNHGIKESPRVAKSYCLLNAQASIYLYPITGLYAPTRNEVVCCMSQFTHCTSTSSMSPISSFTAPLSKYFRDMCNAQGHMPHPPWKPPLGWPHVHRAQSARLSRPKVKPPHRKGARHELLSPSGEAEKWPEECMVRAAETCTMMQERQTDKDAQRM